MYAHVTFPVSSFKTFTYTIPEELQEKIHPGTCVRAPFGKRKMIGYVEKINKESKFTGKILPLTGIHEKHLHIPEELWKTLEWMSRYYLTPLGQVMKSAIPLSFNKSYKPPELLFVSITTEGLSALKNWDKRAPAQKRILDALSMVNEKVSVSSLKSLASSVNSICLKLSDMGFVHLTKKSRITDPFDIMNPVQFPDITLNSEQDSVFQQMERGLQSEKFSPFLLKGVTGCGKTEVYLKLAEATVNGGKTVIVLVPEIALTPAVAQRFRHIFGERVALWHSKLTRAEKGWTWQQLKRGKYSVVVGARSAVFLPLENLGLIVVDEEQEPSFKQEHPAPRYHARDVALVRAKNANAVTLLTSATPSVESYLNGIKKRFTLLELKKRYGQSQYPAVKLVDMKVEHKQTQDFTQTFSTELINELDACISRKEQAIVLQNRRGFSFIQRCRECGWVYECHQCSVTLTYHKVGNHMLCHYCNFSTPTMSSCPDCNTPEIEFTGTGTQKIEDELQFLIPKARIIRMDMDTSRTRGAHYRILKKFGDHKADILLGTQMIAKGLDFENVTLVGVVNADVGLFLPDFRSGERVFQLVYQVAGRSGRREKQGKAIIQTYNPQDIYVQAAARLDTKKFYNISLAERNELCYPPFSRIARIVLTGKKKPAVEELSIQMGDILRSGNFETLGPSPAPLERLQGLWRYHIVVKIEIDMPFSFHNHFQIKLGLEILEKKTRGVKVQVDMDPVTML